MEITLVSIASAALVVYLFCLAAQAGELLMDVRQRMASARAHRRGLRAHHQAVGHLSGQVLDPEARGRHVPRPRPRPVRAPHLPRSSRRPEARSRPGRATPSRMLLFTARHDDASPTCSCACSTGCRSTRRRMAAVRPDLAFNTAASFATNTNWQSYGGESDDELLLADGGAGDATTSSRRPSASPSPRRWCAASRARRARPSATSGATSFARRSTCFLPAALIYAVFLMWQGIPQNFLPYTAAQDASKGATRRRSRRVRSPRRSRSRCWAPTAAAT